MPAHLAVSLAPALAPQSMPPASGPRVQQRQPPYPSTTSRATAAGSSGGKAGISCRPAGWQLSTQKRCGTCAR